MTGAARFDHGARARLLVRGADRKDFLDRLATNALAALAPGQGAPTFFLERTGRVVDRVIVLERGEDALLLGSEGRAEALAEWLTRYVIADDVEVADLGPGTVRHTVLGPAAAGALAAGLGVDAAALAPWAHAPSSVAGAVVARVDDVGGRAFAVIAPREAAGAVEAALAALPAGDATAWRRLRVEAGVPEFGADFTDRTIPLETGRLDHFSFTKGCYVGQEVIARLHNYKRVKRALVRLRVEGAAAPAADAGLYDGDEEVGRVTSAASGESAAIALGYVATEHAGAGRKLVLHDGASRRDAEILPLLPRGDHA